MSNTYSREQRKTYLEMSDRIAGGWLRVFGDDTDFYSAAYWDLFTQVWRATGPVRKTDALRFMTGIKSAHTAGKYLDVAIKRGFLIETDNPQDARSKLLELSPEMYERLDRFFDGAVDEIRDSAYRLQEEGLPPIAHAFGRMR